LIHHTDPFADPEPARSPVRRLRGRFAQTVTLWTAPGPAGLTVSSCLVADGDPGRVIGLIDEESELWTAMSTAGVFAVSVLEAGQRRLADRFAGLMPAPGGLFRQGEQWQETEFGPVPGGTWAGCRIGQTRPFGWGMLVEAEISLITLADPSPPLMHYRGSYHELPGR
jgi:3-hydroxy-9,10-secoandrosta-1,3,5(10)-triene-9,17-dione monooxygenase reductase component